jgi:ketosteroid isomerase-like protein
MKQILMILLFILLGSSFAFSQSEKQKIKIIDNIRSEMNKQVDAWNRGSIEGFMEGYWNSPELKFVSGENVTRGWQPTLNRYKKSYDSKAKMGVLTFSDLQIDVLSKDAAVVLGSWSLQRASDNPHGKFTLIFRKFKDGWKIVHDHTS